MNNETNTVSMEDTGMNFDTMTVEDLTFNPRREDVIKEESTKFTPHFQKNDMKGRKALVQRALSAGNSIDAIKKSYGLSDYWFDCYSNTFEEATEQGMRHVIEWHKKMSSRTMAINYVKDGGRVSYKLTDDELHDMMNAGINTSFEFGCVVQTLATNRGLTGRERDFFVTDAGKAVAKMVYKNEDSKGKSNSFNLAIAKCSNTEGYKAMKTINTLPKANKSTTTSSIFNALQVNSTVAREFAEMKLEMQKLKARTVVLEVTQETLVDHATLNLTDINSLKTAWHRDLVILAREGNKAAAIATQLGLSYISVKGTHARLKKASYFL